VAFTLASAVAYVEEVLKRGIDVDAFARHLSFRFTSCRGFFEEIAKIRAARRLWAGTMRDEFHARDPRSMMLRYFCGGSGASLTAADPLANIIHGTLQCLAGWLAGAQACHVPAYDEAFDVPSEESARLTLRTQQIIAYESGVANTQEALWKGLREGEIDNVGSDHCVFTWAQKVRGREDFTKVPNGLPGVETRLPLLFSFGYSSGRLPLSQLTRVLTVNPARVFGLFPARGSSPPAATPTWC